MLCLLSTQSSFIEENVRIFYELCSYQGMNTALFVF